ncbi:hypothetical protein [Viridibacillus soli]|nr:hypothetical protein [Viridibacillus soli]
MKTTVSDTYENELLKKVDDDRVVLLTDHFRENLGEPMYHIFKAI